MLVGDRKRLRSTTVCCVSAMLKLRLLISSTRKLSSIPVGRRCARQELEVDVATVGCLADIIGSASERLFSTHLDSELLVPVIGIFDVWLVNKGFATSPSLLARHSDNVEEPKAARRHLVCV